MSLRGLVSFGPPSEATVGVFVVPKKLGKQRLIFDTRRVNQHFRRPWHCALPTPASWAGLQLPVDSTYHMAQTDVNTAFYCILAPLGMCQNTSSCQECPLNCSCVKVWFQIICCICLMRHRNLRSWIRFFWSSLFLSKDGGMLRPVSWLFCGRLAHGSSLGTCDDSRLDLSRGLC